MEEGHVSEMGSYHELMERKEAFAKFIHTFNGNQRREGSTARDKSKGPYTRGAFSYCVVATSAWLWMC